VWPLISLEIFHSHHHFGFHSVHNRVSKGILVRIKQDAFLIVVPRTSRARMLGRIMSKWRGYVGFENGSRPSIGMMKRNERVLTTVSRQGTISHGVALLCLSLSCSLWYRVFFLQINKEGNLGIKGSLDGHHLTGEMKIV